MSGQLTGSGALALTGSTTGSSIIFSGDASQFSGTLNFNGQATNNVFVSAGADNLAAATLNFTNASANGGFGVGYGGAGSATIQLGALSGNFGSLYNNVASTTATYQVGALNTNTSFGGVIANVVGTTALTKVGTGTLILAGANTYSGATAITAGAVELGNANALQSTTVSVNVNGGLLFAAGIDAPNIGALAGAGNVTLQDLTTPTALAVTPLVGADNASTTYSGVLSGSGGLVKVGTGTLLLSGANTYTGGTAINSGVLQLGNSAALQNSSVSVNVNSGLSFGAGITAPSIGALAGSGNVTLSDTNSTPAAVSLTAGSNNASTAYSGVLGGLGGLAKTGSGVMTLSTAATYSGATTISGGTLRLAPLASLPTNISGVLYHLDASNPAGYTVSGGTVTQFNDLSGNGNNFTYIVRGSSTSGASVVTSAIHGLTALSFSGSQALTLSNSTTPETVFIVDVPGSSQQNLAGSWGNSSGDYGIRTFNNTNAWQVHNGNNGDYVDSGSAPGTTGNMYINGVQVNAATSNGTFTALQPQILAATNSTAVAFGSTGIGEYGTGGALNRFFTGDIGEVIGYSGVLNSTQLAAVTAYLNYKWFGTVTPGFAGTNLLPTTTTVSLTASGASLDLTGSSQTIASLSGVGGTTVTLGGGVLTLNTSGSASFAGNITDGGGILSATGGQLVMQGTGTQTLGGVNAYSGATSINQGTLALAVGGSLANTPITVGSGTSNNGTLLVSGGNVGTHTYTIGTGTSGSLTISGAANNTSGQGTLGFSGGETSTSMLTVNGTLTFGGASTGLSSNLLLNMGNTSVDSIATNSLTINTGGVVLGLSQLAGTTIAAGTPSVPDIYTLITSTNNITNPAGLTFAGGQTAVAANGDLFKLSSTATTELLSVIAISTPANAYWYGPNDTSWTSYNATATNPTNWVSAINSTTDAGGPPGATTNVVFSANNAINLATVLNANVSIASLTFNGNTGPGGAPASGAVTIGPGSPSTNTLTIGSAGITVNSGAGANTISAGVILGASQPWTNNTTGSAGLLTVSGNITGNGNTLTFAGGGKFTISGNILDGSPAGTAVTVNASGGTVTFTGSANAYTGLTTITAGTLQLGDGASLNSSVAGDILDNASLVFANPNTQSFGGAISGNGAVTKTAAGTLTLSNAASSYSGTTTISGGTLRISADTDLGAAPGSPTPGQLVINGGTLATTSSMTLATNRGIALGPAGGSGGGTLSPAASTTLVYGGDISDNGSGMGNLTINGGAGSTVSLTGSSSYSGGTTLTAGTVAVGTGSALGSGQITLNGGTLVGGNFTLSNSIQVNNVAGNTVYTNTSNLLLSGPITGSGTVAFTGSTSAASIFLSGDTSGFTGTLSFNGQANNNLLVGAAADNLSQATLSFSNASSNGGFSFGYNGAGSATIQLGALTGNFGGLFDNVPSTTANFQVGALNTNTNFGGLIFDGNGTTALTKVGSGSLDLTGANTYTGTTTVTAGVLELGNTNAVQSSTVSVNVNGGLSFAAGIDAPNIGGLAGSGNVALADQAGAPCRGHADRRRRQCDHDL